jgi:hypothetical protein
MNEEIMTLADQVADLIGNNYSDLPDPVREQLEIASAQLLAAGRTMRRGGEMEASDDPDAVHRAVRQGYAMSRRLAGDEDEAEGIKI